MSLLKPETQRVVTALLLLSAGSAWAWEPDPGSPVEQRVAAATARFEARLPERYFSEAFGYVILPAVKRFGFGLGGAWGQGLAFVGDEHAGRARFWQITSGIQFGGRSVAMIVLFRDEDAWTEYTQGRTQFMGQAGAAILGVGRSATPAYDSGVAIFTLSRFGVMAEATVAVGRLSYRAAESESGEP